MEITSFGMTIVLTPSVGASLAPLSYQALTTLQLENFPSLDSIDPNPSHITGTTGVTDGITVNVFGENIEAGMLQSASGVNSSGALWFSIVVE